VGSFRPYRRCELAGIDIIEAALDIQEKGRDLGTESLEEANLMGEGGCGVEGGEAREGSCLVRMKQAYVAGQEGETSSNDSLQYLGQGFEQDNDPEGGRGIIGGLARLIQHHAICFLQGGGVMSVL